MSLFLLGAEYIVNYFKNRNLEKNILGSKYEIKCKIENIEDIIEDTRNEVFNKKYVGWGKTWDALNISRKKLSLIKDDVTSMRLEQKLEGLSEQKELINAIYATISCLETECYDREEGNYLIAASNISKEVAEKTRSIEKALRTGNKSILQKETKTDPRGYLLSVFGKLDCNVPEYSPNPGIFLKDSKKWRVKNGENVVVGKYGRFRSKLEISCEYRQSEPEFKEIENQTKKSRTQKVMCYTMPVITEDFKKFVKNYNSNNLNLVVHELSTGETVYNTNNEWTEYFSGYFVPEKTEQLTFVSKIRNISNNGIVNLSQLKRLGKNIHLDLVKLGMVTPLSNGVFYLNE